MTTRDRVGAVPTAVTETESDWPIPLLIHPGWTKALPWLLQGTTWRGEGEAFDLALSGDVPVGRALDRWRTLRRETAFEAAIHARQIHGTTVMVHEHALAGLLVAEGADGHATRIPGLLLTVSVADCIPVFIADPVHRTIALLHAGWRGVAAGIIEAGLRTMAASFATRPADVLVHFGPAICGECYEVGPEVHERLGLPAPPGPQPVDLRDIGAARVTLAGVPAAAISVSTLCSRCSPGRFFSHRAGSAGRQVGLLGIRPEGGAA